MIEKDIRLEVRRQLVHSCGIFTIFLIIFLGMNATRTIIGLLIIALLSVAVYRKFRKKPSWPIELFNRLEIAIERYICSYERPNEFPLKGALLFYLGIFIVLLFFSSEISIISIAILAISDAISTLVGKIYGKHKLPINSKKSWEGSLGFFISSLMIFSFFNSISLTFILAMAVTFVEMWPKIDDNLSIPISTAIFLYIVKTFI